MIITKRSRVAIPKRSYAIRESAGDRVFLIGVYSILGLIFLVVAYPLIYIVSSSFSSAAAVQRGAVWLWPVQPSLDGYRAVFQDSLLLSGFLNSLFYTGVGSVVSVALTVMMAYPLSRRNFVGRRIFIWALLFALLFNGGLIPFYLIVKDLGLLNTRWALIFPAALGIFQVFLAKSFFQTTISSELYEAAQLDGCSELQFFRRIVLPLSSSILAVLFLLYAVGQWNSYFNALIFLNDQSLYPLQLVLRGLLIMGQNQIQMTAMTPEQYAQLQNMVTLLKYAVIVVVTVPMLALYPFVQKYFVKGVMLGSLKE
jgi:ABC-type glycerol-3-phosphate transport system permease component